MIPGIIRKMAFLFLLSPALVGQSDTTYADRLGFPKGARVIILHVDDAGMSYDSDKGVEEAIEKGLATSTSVMMPCPWVPGFVHYLRQHPSTDAGLHLTLTSEWKDYRWGPVAGQARVPGLTDAEGCLWHDVPDVVGHATPDEVELELRAQVEKALKMGFQPTHLDSHMGTLFASPAFLERYIRVGLAYKIPVMLPGGHNTLILEQTRLAPASVNAIRQAARMLWNAGFPVLDDLHNFSYGWNLPAGVEPTRANWAKYKTEQYMATLRHIRPGITMVIMHCTDATEIFHYISDSGPTREGDLDAMMNPDLRKFIEDQGFILTTWRELKQRRERLQ
jgi:predicted glycoside hydrolase/deacetylase ChbG (UPF0249 family)